MEKDMIRFCIILLVIISCSSPKSVVNYQSENVIDIEVPAKQVKAFCSIPGDPAKKNYFIQLYVFHEEQIINVSYLHVVTKKACEINVSLLRNLIEKSKKIRVIGTSKLEGGPDSELSIHMNNPEMNYVNSNWQLSRVLSEKGCQDFLQLCSAPLDTERKMYGE
jgi:hypothetical protein